MLTLILVYVPPSSYCSSMQKILVNLPKVQVASYSLHIMYVALHWQTAAVSCGNSHASAVSTPLRWTFKNVLQKAIHSCRITRKCSESVWGSRTAPYKKRSTNSALEGAGIAQWLERRTRDWKVAGSNPCWNGRRIFFSRVDFLCWLLFRYPFHPRVTTVARKKSRSFCQKVQVAGYS